MTQLFPNIRIKNEDCISGVKYIDTNSVNLIICDPPFGIYEGSFDKHYKRDSDHVLGGYVEAPEDYVTWTLQWMTEARRILSQDGQVFTTFWQLLPWEMTAMCALGVHRSILTHSPRFVGIKIC